MHVLKNILQKTKPRQVDSVFLCRSPLQARICLEIIEKIKVYDFDIIYFTQDDNELDKIYFSKLSREANFSTYIFIKKNNKDIMNHLSAIFEIKKIWPFTQYNNIYIGSIDNYLFRFIIKKNPKSTLIGFDDGAANITSFGHYYNLNKYKRPIIYSKILRLPQPEDIKHKLTQHYTIYNGFDNIVPQDKITFISLFSVDPRLNNRNSDDSNVITYFIGQPFYEYLSSKKISILKTWLAKQKIDNYVLHPREHSPLIQNIPLLEKKGMLAEDAIFKNSNGSRVRIISAYSTVLFNIDHNNADKIYLSLSDDPNEKERRRLIEKTGSEIITLF